MLLNNTGFLPNKAHFSLLWIGRCWFGRCRLFVPRPFCTLIEKFKSEFDLGRLTAQRNTTLHQAWCEYEHAVLKNLQDSIGPLSFLYYNCLLPPHTAALLHLNSTMPRTFVAYTSHHVARIIKPRCSENKISKIKQAPTPAASLVAFHFAHQLLQQTKTRAAP